MNNVAALPPTVSDCLRHIQAGLFGLLQLSLDQQCDHLDQHCHHLADLYDITEAIDPVLRFAGRVDADIEAGTTYITSLRDELKARAKAGGDR